MQSHFPRPKWKNNEAVQDAIKMFEFVCRDAEGTRLLIKELHNRTDGVREAAVFAPGSCWTWRRDELAAISLDLISRIAGRLEEMGRCILPPHPEIET